MNNILPSILSAHTVSIWRFHSIRIGVSVNVSIGYNDKSVFPLISVFCLNMLVRSRSPGYKQWSVHSCCFSCAMFWQTDMCKWSKEIIYDQTQCHQINGVRVWKLFAICISLWAPCWCNRWPDKSHKPPLLAVWLYFTAGALLFKRSTDKISEVISHFASVQSNCSFRRQLPIQGL